MRRVLIALVAAVLLAACAHSAATQPTASTAAPFNDADITFLQAMIPHHRQGIDMAELVDGHTQRPELVKLAAGITASRDAEIHTMQGFLARWNRPAPAAQAADHESPVPGMLGQGQLDWLQTLNGAQFDLGFVTMMRTHHGGAVEQAEAELGAGTSAAVKALARQMIAAQQAEIRQLQQWKDAWA
jgi:uncharacterized protein (DUF305 family)